MKDYIIQLLENAGVSLPNENSLGQKIVSDDDPDKLSNFWNWFGDSKAVDSQGRPLVFFHGSSSKRNGRDIPEFSSFDRSKLGKKSHFSSKVGFFFSSSEAMAKGFGDRIMAVYLKMDRPMQYNSGSNVDSELEEKYYKEHKKDDEYADRPLRAIQKHTDSYDKFVADIYHKNGDIPYWAVNEISFYDAYNLGDKKDEYINNYVNALKQEGYDSIVINNTVADKSVNGGYKTTQYCVFEPNQIKSIKNNGNFSDSDNIYESIQEDKKYQLNDNFWNWFGDSKTIKDGSPMIFYHGTPNEFSVFDITKSSPYGNVGRGFYFTDTFETAQNYIGGLLGRKTEKSHVKECYLRMENPYDLDEIITDNEILNLAKLIKNNNDSFWFNKILEDINYRYSRKSLPVGWDFDEGMLVPFDRITKGGLSDAITWLYNKKILMTNQLTRDNVWFVVTDGYHTNKSKEYLKEWLLENGYDSVIFSIVGDNKGNGTYRNKCYVVFKSNQIKSVDNKGLYSIENDDIYESIEYAEMLNDGTMYEIHKNPTDKEFWDLLRHSKYKKLRALVSVDEKERLCFVWDAYYSGTHNVILTKYLSKYNQNMSHYAQVYCTEKGIEVFGLCPNWFEETYYKPTYSKDEIDNTYKELQDIFNNDDLGLLNETIAYHGSSKLFDKFSLDFVGTGDKGREHGYGFLFAVEKETAEKYNKGYLYTVEIPDEMYLIHEDDFIRDQPLYVHYMFEEIAKKYFKDYRYKWEDIQRTHGGMNFYFMLAEILSKNNDDGYRGEKLASELLNSYGILGMCSDRRDGMYYTIFDPKKIDILKVETKNKLNEDVAYAASKSDYEKPSLKAIGTGEGHAAHGWGLYYTANKDVAEDYLQFFSKTVVEYKGKIYDSPVTRYCDELNDNEKLMIGTAVECKTYKGTLYDLEQMIRGYAPEPLKEKVNNCIALFKETYKNGSLKFIISKSGALHSVDLPAPNDMVVEDKSIYNQSQSVSERLLKAFDPYKKKLQSRLNKQYPDYKGKDVFSMSFKIVYELFAEVIYKAKTGKPFTWMVVSKKEYKEQQQNLLLCKRYASMYLLKNGIKGIIYDGGRDGKCYVIFNPNDVKVIEKEVFGENK